MVVETIFASPLLVAVLIGVLILAVHFQRGLTYTEYRIVHLLKARLSSVFEQKVRKRFGLSIINDKRYRDDDEFIRTIDKSPREVFKRIRSEKNASPHLIAATKRRHFAGGSELTHSQLVTFDHEAGRQTEWYLFANGDGTTDLYGHNEVSIFDPENHIENTDQKPAE